MPRFIKDNVKESQEKKDKTSISKEIDVLSSNYFPPLEDQMKQKEVALMFQRSVQTICAWTKANKIPYFRLGRHPIYSRKQLISFASNNQSLISNK